MFHKKYLKLFNVPNKVLKQKQEIQWSGWQPKGSQSKSYDLFAIQHFDFSCFSYNQMRTPQGIWPSTH